MRVKCSGQIIFDSGILEYSSKAEANTWMIQWRYCCRPRCYDKDRGRFLTKEQREGEGQECWFPKGRRERDCERVRANWDQENWVGQEMNRNSFTPHPFPIPFCSPRGALLSIFCSLLPRTFAHLIARSPFPENETKKRLVCRLSAGLFKARLIQLRNMENFDFSLVLWWGFYCLSFSFE